MFAMVRVVFSVFIQTRHQSCRVTVAGSQSHGHGGARWRTVAHGAAGIHARIAHPTLPVPAPRIAVLGESPLIFRVGQAVRKAGADPHIFTTGAIHLGNNVWIFTSTTNGLMPQDQTAIHLHPRLRHEKPLTLADEGPIVTTGTLAQIETRGIRGVPGTTGLQGKLGLDDAGSASGHGRHEPFPLVVSAEEAIFRYRGLHKQEQVAVTPLALEHIDLKLLLTLFAELQLEGLTKPIANDVERIIRAPAPSRQVFWTNDAEPGAHAGELIRYRFKFHILEFEPRFLARPGVFRLGASAAPRDTMEY